MKNLIKNRSSLRQALNQISKCRKYTCVSTDLLVDAYVLAKTIHESHGYKLFSIQELEKVLKSCDLVLHIEKINEEKVFSHHCTITLLDNLQVSVKYNSVIYKEKTKFYSIEIECDKIFYYFYLLAILVLFYDELEKGQYMEFHYGEYYSRNVNEEIAITVALFLLYIKYDYDYRIKKYPFNHTNDRGFVTIELPPIHPQFINPYDFSYIKAHIIGNHTLATHYKQEAKNYESNVYFGYKCDNLSWYTLENMIHNIEILETNFSKDYEELSKMSAPIEEYLKYKYIDLYTFGAIRKIDF